MEKKREPLSRGRLYMPWQIGPADIPGPNPSSPSRATRLDTDTAFPRSSIEVSALKHTTTRRTKTRGLIYLPPRPELLRRHPEMGYRTGEDLPGDLTRRREAINTDGYVDRQPTGYVAWHEAKSSRSHTQDAGQRLEKVIVLTI